MKRLTLVLALGIFYAACGGSSSDPAAKQSVATPTPVPTLDGDYYPSSVSCSASDATIQANVITSDLLAIHSGSISMFFNGALSCSELGKVQSISSNQLSWTLTSATPDGCAGALDTTTENYTLSGKILRISDTSGCTAFVAK